MAVVATAGVVGAMGVGLASRPAHAAEANGCNGSAVSVNRDGTDLDRADAPGEGGTQGDPLQLDPYGQVRWQYAFASDIRNGTWKITGSGPASLSFSGEVGADQKQSDNGTEDLEQHLVRDLPLLGKVPVFTGLLKGDVIVAGSGATCTFSGWVEIGGNPARTPLFALAALLMLAAMLLFFLGWPVEHVMELVSQGAAGSAS